MAPGGLLATKRQVAEGIADYLRHSPQTKHSFLPGILLLTLLVGAVLAFRWGLRARRARKAAGLQRRRLRDWRIPPVLALYFLAPFVAEGLSGATPPAVFFGNPVVLAYFMSFYGSGALLIREATLAWGKGWPTRLTLGAAYAICEEGFATKVFFDPHRSAMGAQVNWGNAGGVHWPFTFHLLVYHSVFSISIPIFLAWCLYPQRANEPWVRRRWLPVVGATLAAGIALGAIKLYPYNPGTGHYILAGVAVAALVLVAWRLPARLGPSRLQSPAPPWKFAALGFLGSVAFWTASYLFPSWGVPGAVGLLAEIAVAVAVGAGVLHLAGWTQTWSPYHCFALVGGMLAFIMSTSVLLDVVRLRGQTIVAAVSVYYLLRLRRRMRSRAGLPVTRPARPRSG